MSSGLGGMSGAQPKAATICGCIGVVAEVSFFLRVITHILSRTEFKPFLDKIKSYINYGQAF